MEGSLGLTNQTSVYRPLCGNFLPIEGDAVVRRRCKYFQVLVISRIALELKSVLVCSDFSDEIWTLNDDYSLLARFCW